jgi:hypothetical protein
MKDHLMMMRENYVDYLIDLIKKGNLNYQVFSKQKEEFYLKDISFFCFVLQ